MLAIGWALLAVSAVGGVLVTTLPEMIVVVVVAFTTGLVRSTGSGRDGAIFGALSRRARPRSNRARRSSGLAV